MTNVLNGRVAASVLGLALFASSAAAHHGWTWTVEEQSELTGVIREIFIGNPHAVLNVEAEGGIWISQGRAVAFETATRGVSLRRRPSGSARNAR